MNKPTSLEPLKYVAPAPPSGGLLDRFSQQGDAIRNRKFLFQPNPHRGESHAFDGPKPDTLPHLRVRTVDEENLERLYDRGAHDAEQKRKDRVIEKHMSDQTIIEKMLQCNIFITY